MSARRDACCVCSSCDFIDSCLRCSVDGFGFRVSKFGFRVQDLRAGGWVVLLVRLAGLLLRVQHLEHSSKCLGVRCRVWVLRSTA